MFTKQAIELLLNLYIIKSLKYVIQLLDQSAYFEQAHRIFRLKVQ